MTDKPVLSLEGVSLRYAGLQALEDVSFDLYVGEVRAVIGPNGAGKTSLFNVVSGYVRPSAGAIRFRDQPITGWTAHRVSALGVRRTFQNGGLFPRLTVLENVLCGLHATTVTGVFATALGLPAARRAEARAVARARELLDLMNIAHLESDLAENLSGGQQRMVEIVRTLATDPPLVLLDEPAVGLAPPVREDLLAVIRRIAHEEKRAVLLIEHAIELIMGASDRIIVLNAGRKIAEGTPEEIRQNTEVAEAYLGHA